MKTTKTTILAFAIVTVASMHAIAQNESVKLKPVNQDTYQLTYLKQCPCDVKIEIIDQKGRRLFSENIRQDRPFVKPYNFRKLKDNEFDFKVIDKDGAFTRKIKRTEEVSMVAGITSLPNKRAKVIVEGDIMAPVYVKLYDRYGILIFEDFINRERGFSRIYDLTKVNADNLTIEVLAGSQIRATAEY